MADPNYTVEQMGLPPAAAAGQRNRRSRRKLSGDTVEVKRKIAPITISDSSNQDVAVQDEVSRQLVHEASTATDSTSRNIGKGKGRIVENADFDDHVTEYEFSDEDLLDEDEDDLDDDAKSVITLSSECSQLSEDGLPERPWTSFSIPMRRQWEVMYLNVTENPIGGNWVITEDYQEKKDAEMLHYLEDFPLQEWVIPKEEADKAYDRLLQRSRWRMMGIRIYNDSRARDWAPGSSPGSRIQQPLNIPHDQYRREPVPHAGPPDQQGPPIQGPSGQVPPPQLLAQHSMPTYAPNPTLPHLPAPQHMQLHGPGRPPTYPHGLPNGTIQPMGRGLPPPLHGLPSQPYAQPIPLHHGPHGMGRPAGPLRQIGYGSTGFPPHHGMQPGGFRPEPPKPRRGRDKKETPPPPTPPPPPPTPPYKLREKPIDPKGSKGARRTARRQAEADEFPWTRQLKFPEEKAKAGWDDSVYDPKTLEQMSAIRSRNIPIIEDLDAKVQEQQRIARQNKKAKEGQKDGNADTSDVEEGKEKKKMQRGQRKGESGGDPYHSGAFAFATSEDEEKASKLGYKTPDEAVEAGEDGKLEEDKQADIKICWNPGKKGTTENLEQVKFSLKDTLVTRKQLKTTNILTLRAAECIIDFCPDMLWRGMLLRICSEAGMGNKDVRDRFCYNGCYCDKATITKRISAALGQKQVQPKSKGYADGEYDWYEENVKDYAKYIDYFGKRVSHRNMLKIQMQGEKRKMKQRELEASASGDRGDEGGPSKRAKLDSEGKEINSDVEGKETSDAIPDSDDEDGGVALDDGNESDASDDSNAVSLQDSDILDKMEED